MAAAKPFYPKKQKQNDGPFSIVEKEIVLPSGEKIIHPVKVYSTLDMYSGALKAQPTTTLGKFGS
jgi:hypothetical protein